MRAAVRARIVFPDLFLQRLPFLAAVLGEVAHRFWHMVVAREAHRQNAEAHAACLCQRFSSGEDGAARGQNVVDEEDVAARH